MELRAEGLAFTILFTPPDDEGWMWCNATVNAPGFRGDLDFQMLRSDLDSFRDANFGVDMIEANWPHEVRLSSTDPGIDLAFRIERTGQITGTYRIRRSGHTPSLAFRSLRDGSDLPRSAGSTRRQGGADGSPVGVTHRTFQRAIRSWVPRGRSEPDPWHPDATRSSLEMGGTTTHAFPPQRLYRPASARSRFPRGRSRLSHRRATGQGRPVGEQQARDGSANRQSFFPERPSTIRSIRANRRDLDGIVIVPFGPTKVIITPWPAPGYHRSDSF